MSRTIKIENKSGAAKTWIGQRLVDNEMFDIPEHRMAKWANNSTVITDVASGDLKLVKSEGPTVYYTAVEGQRVLDGLDAKIAAAGGSGEYVYTTATGDIVWGLGAIIIKDEGTPVSADNCTAMNFMGPPITVVDAGGGQVDVTVVALMDILEDTTPQLGGMLDINGNSIGDGTNILLDFVEDASAINYIQIENEATGSGPIIRAVGADTDVDLLLEPQGTGNILLSGLTFPNVDGTSDQVLKTDGAGQLSWVVGGNAVTLSAVQARRTTSFNITTSFADVPLDTTDVETDVTAIEHNNTNTERIDIKVNGIYTVLYNLFTITNSDVSSRVTIFTRVLKNGSTLLAGSDLDVGYYYSASTGQTENPTSNRSVTMSLSAGDYLTLQTKYVEYLGPITSVDTSGDVIFKAIKLDGVQGADGADGADGAPGSGTTLIAKDEGTNVANTPHSAFNFVGSGVTVTDAGAGVADVTVSGGGIYGSEFQQASSDTESSTTATTFQQKLRMTTSSLPSGTYRVAWYYEWKHTNTSHDFVGQVEINDIITIMEHKEEPQDSGDSQYHSHGGFYYHTGSGILNVDIDYSRSSSAGGTAYIRRARLEIWRLS